MTPDALVGYPLMFAAGLLAAWGWRRLAAARDRRHARRRAADRAATRELNQMIGL
jgi:cytochrome b